MVALPRIPKVVLTRQPVEVAACAGRTEPVSASALQARTIAARREESMCIGYLGIVSGPGTELTELTRRRTIDGDETVGG